MDSKWLLNNACLCGSQNQLSALERIPPNALRVAFLHTPNWKGPPRIIKGNPEQPSTKYLTIDLVFFYDIENIPPLTHELDNIGVSNYVHNASLNVTAYTFTL